MAKINVNDILQVTLFSTFKSQTAANVLHFQAFSVTGDPLDLKTALDDLSTNYGTVLKPLLNNDAGYNGLQGQVIHPAVGIPEVTIVGKGPGDAGASALPTQVSGVISKRTSEPSRSGRGRMYVPFPSQQDCDDNGEPTTGYITRLQLLADKLVGDITVDDGQGNTLILASGVWSRKLGQFVGIELGTARQKWGTQRSRGDYGAHNAAPF